MGLLLGVAIGLVVGWLFLPMPAWVKAFYDNLTKKKA